MRISFSRKWRKELRRFSGGMKPLEALHIATMGGAKALGLDKDPGSLEPGKIADVLILDKNPLDNIQNSESIRYVMKCGFLYDGGTLNRIWPTEKKFEAFPWANKSGLSK